MSNSLSSGSAGNVNANGTFNPNTYSIGSSIGGYGFGTITISQSRAAYSVKWVGDDLVMIFAAEENNVSLNLELAAERDITPFEQLHLQKLISSFAMGAAPTPAGAMSYVRKHNLERHFRISLA